MSSAILDPFNLVKHGGSSHDQDSHGNRGGHEQTGGSNLNEAWDAITFDTPWNAGWEAGSDPIDIGEVVTRRIGALEGGSPEIVDYRMTPLSELDDWGSASRPPGNRGMPTHRTSTGAPAVLVEVAGSRRPLPAVFRIVDEAEYQHALATGHLKSDGRMNLAADEGTVFSDRDTGTFYAPPAGRQTRILRFDATRVPGLRNDPVDQYLKTDAAVPVTAITHVSPLFDVPEEKTYPTEYRVAKHKGPGAHPNGSPQTAHAGRGGGPFDSEALTTQQLNDRLLKVFGSNTVLNTVSHASAGPAGTAPSEALLETIKGLYDHGQINDRYSTRLSDLTVKGIAKDGGGYVMVQGHIVDDDSGEPVGEWTRIFRSDGSVTHDYFGIQPDHQGQGLGKDFSEMSETAYRKAGFDRIKLTAGLNVGGYAWARAGYTFETTEPDSLNDPRLRANDLAADLDGGMTGSVGRSEFSLDGDMVVREFNGQTFPVGDKYRVFDVAMDPYVTPQQIAALGADRPWDVPFTDPPQKSWLGKEILLGSTYKAVKMLNAEVPAVAKAWLDEVFPSRLDGESESAYLARLAATAPDDVYDTPIGESVAKHKGPGAHPNGSPQSVHGGGGGGSAPATATRHPMFGQMYCGTREEAIERLSAVFPNARIGLGRTFERDNYAGEPLGGSVAGLEKMATEFPEAAAEVVRVTFNSESTEANGEVKWEKDYRSTTEEPNAPMEIGLAIHINTAKNGRGPASGALSTLDQVKEQLRTGQRWDPFTAGSHRDIASFNYDIAVHEFGHVVHNTAMRKVTGEDYFEGAPGDEVQWNKNDRMWTEQFGPDRRMIGIFGPKAATELFAATNYPSTPAADWAERLDTQRVPVNEYQGDFDAVPARQISEYATYNRAELVAETFTMRHGIGHNDHNRHVPMAINDIVIEIEEASRGR